MPAPELRIVPDELWAQVHDRLRQQRAVYLRGTKGQLGGRPAQGREAKYLLSGLARGAICNGSMAVKTRSQAVVVSTDAYHQRRPDVIVMAVTSQILRPAGALGEVLISDWQGAGLPKASLIKPVLATIEQRLILRKLGARQGDDVQALRSALRQILG